MLPRGREGDPRPGWAEPLRRGRRGFREDLAAAGLPAGGRRSPAGVGAGRTIRTTGPAAGNRAPLGPHAPRLPPPPTRIGAGRPTPTPACRPGTGLLLHRLRYGPVLPPHRRLGHECAHGAPTTRLAPLADDPGAQGPRGPMPDRPGAPRRPRIAVPVHRLHRTTRRRGHRGIRRSRGILLRRRRRPGPGQAPANAGPVLARRPPGPQPPDG